MNIFLSQAVRGIDMSLHEPYASLLKGLVYGLPIQIDPEFKLAIVKSGLAHLVVLSGSNVTLLAEFSEKLFFSFSRRWGIILQLIFLGFFVVLVGPQAPLIRAICMFICTSVCIITGRPSYGWWNLFLTIFFVSLFKPEWITSVSFILSVFATMGILLWDSFVSHFNLKIHPLGEVFFESWLVFLLTVPITVFYFKSISFMSPVSTALVSWIVVPIMVAGFVISITSLILPSITYIFAAPTQIALQYMVIVIKETARVPFGYISFQ